MQEKYRNIMKDIVAGAFSHPESHSNCTSRMTPHLYRNLDENHHDLCDFVSRRRATSSSWPSPPSPVPAETPGSQLGVRLWHQEILNACRGRCNVLAPWKKYTPERMRKTPPPHPKHHDNNTKALPHKIPPLQLEHQHKTITTNT